MKRVSTDFVPRDFAVPTELTFLDVRLVPLGPEHNAADYRSWSSSIDHIRATPGFPDGTWPRPMPLEENLRDLERHAEDFRLRRGFTYTVLDRDGRCRRLRLHLSVEGRSDRRRGALVGAR